MMSRLAEAIRFPTVSYPKDEAVDWASYRAFLQFLRQSYPKVYEQLEVELVDEYNVMLRWPGSSEHESVLILAHYDVVPAQMSDGWDIDPFAGVIRDDAVWGRGAIDDKSNVILWHEVLENLLEEGYVPERSVIVCFGRDEEIGGEHGAGLMAAKLREQGERFHVIFDEGGAVTSGVLSGLSKPVALIGVAEKGSTNLRICLKGGAGHSSMPPRVNLIDQMSRFLNRLQQQPMPVRLIEPVQRMFEAIGPDMPKTGWLIRRIDRLFPVLSKILEKSATTNALIRTTITPTMISGGSAPNVLPGQACVTLNLRILPGDTVAETMKHIERLLEGMDYQMETLLHQEASPTTSTDSAPFRQYQQLIEKHFPEAIVSSYLMAGGTDTKHYQDMADHIFRFSPVRMTKADLDSVHSVNEKISRDNLETGYRFYHDVLRAFTTEEKV